MLELVLLTVCLTLPIGGTPSLTVYPVVEVSGVDVPGSSEGMALPFLILNEFQPGGTWRHGHIRDHELAHHRQMRNLGILSFFVSYAMTLGVPFEDYKDPDQEMLDYPTYNSCGGYL